jgi:hypothetical protein
MQKRSIVLLASGACVLLALSALTPGRPSEEAKGSFRSDIPKTWDDAAIASLEVPLESSAGGLWRFSRDDFDGQRRAKHRSIPIRLF